MPHCGSLTQRTGAERVIHSISANECETRCIGVLIGVVASKGLRDVSKPAVALSVGACGHYNSAAKVASTTELSILLSIFLKLNYRSEPPECGQKSSNSAKTVVSFGGAAKPDLLPSRFPRTPGKDP